MFSQNTCKASSANFGIFKKSTFIERNRKSLQKYSYLVLLKNTKHEFLFQVQYRGDNFPIKSLNVAALLPSTEQYMTYEGSFTQPGCYETVTWLILNKPIYLGRSDWAILRSLIQGDRATSAKSPLAPNVRPIQDLNGRSIRTNIDFGKVDLQAKDVLGMSGDGRRNKLNHRNKGCPDLANNSFYSANPQGGSA
jgi:hypothetical protein